MKKRIISLVLAVLMIVSILPAPAFATDGDAPVAAITTPFYKDLPLNINGNTVYSDSYRIPAMVTLKNGTIVAAADIRWNTTYDGGGLDTVVAYSADGGATWNYTVANYFGDNGDAYDGKNSTAFLDPSLLVAADGKTVYMLVDLYPYGVALNGSKTNGVDDNTVPSTKVLRN